MDAGVVLAVFVALFASQLSGEAANIFCVLPPGEVAIKTDHFTDCGQKGQQCEERKTWNQYLANQPRYFREVEDSTFYFCPGTHYMNRSLAANGTENGTDNLVIAGASPNDVLLVASSGMSRSTPFIFKNFSSVSVEGIAIKLCVSVDPTADQYNTGVLYFTYVESAIVWSVVLNNVCNGSEIYYGDHVDNISISHLSVKKSEESLHSSVYFSIDSGTVVRISNSTFELLSDNGLSQGAYVFIDFSTELVQNSSVVIESCVFTCRNALRINLGLTSLLSLMNVSTDGACVNGSHYGKVAVLIKGAGGYVAIANSLFYNFNSAVYATNVLIAIYNTIFRNNSGTFTKLLSNVPHGSALSLNGNIGLLSNCTFEYNGIANTPYATPNSKTLLLSDGSFTITNSSFSHNMGQALYSYLSEVLFIDNIYFTFNKGFEGAAMYLYVDENSNIQYSQAVIVFSSNIATNTGGAMKIVNKDSDHPVCPFNRLLSPPGNSTLLFLANYAESGGHDIYGGHLDQAILYQNNIALRCMDIVRKTMIFFTPSLSAISSKASRACLCNRTHSPDCLKIFDSRSAYPGEDITLSVVAVGQNFGTSSGFVSAELLLPNNSLSANLSGQQQYQVVQPQSCNNLTYTVHAQAGLEVILVLTTQVGQIEKYGNKEEVNASISDYIHNNRSFVPKQLLNFPVYINVTLKHCPSGFKISDAKACTCFSELLEIDGVQCHMNKKELQRSGTVWIGNQTDTGAVIFSKYCPYNYCKSAKVNIFDSFDAQCQWKHTGVLCGACPKGMSLTLGTSQCKKCSNKHLYLLAPFAIGGLALVVFLKVTDLTTAGGLINGLTLYANLVKAGCYIYFPSNVPYLKPFQVFIDWLNLDFGIEVCFFNGLTAYWKTWLQFVFPSYLWVLAFSMIILARYSIKMASLLGNNSVPVLTTLFMLSYAKIFRVVTTAMKYTVIMDIYGHKSTVWSYDGSIAYFGLHHSIQFTVSTIFLVFLWLPYTCVIMFAQYLQRCRIQKVSRFISRMQPFIDAHCGPFKTKSRYWFGVLLVARAIPLLVAVASSTNADQNAILSTVFVVTVLLLIRSGRVYRKLHVELSELVFLLNLLFLSGSTLYSQSINSPQHQEVFTAIFVGVSFVQFIVVVLLSTAKHLQKFGYHRKWSLLSNTVNIPEFGTFRNDQSCELDRD